MLTFKAGQTYICTESNEPWWTVGEEYKVKRCDDYGLCIFDDDGEWYTQTNVNRNNTQFKLKEEQKVPEEEQKVPEIDLNELTNEELLIYCDLIKNATEAQRKLDAFIKLKYKQRKVKTIKLVDTP